MRETERAKEREKYNIYNHSSVTSEDIVLRFSGQSGRHFFRTL